MAFQNCTNNFAISQGLQLTSSSTDESSSTSNVTPGTKNLLINVNDYGATADGSLDSTTAFQKAIAAAKAAGAGAQIVFGPGKYRLDCPVATNQQTCLMIEGASGISFVGAGSGKTTLLVGNPVLGLLAVVGSSQVVVQGFSLDYSSLPFTQGTVVAIDATANSADVISQTGFPSFDSPMFTPTNVANSFAMDMDPTTTNLNPRIQNALFVKSFTKNGDGSWHFVLDTVYGMTVGDQFVLPIRTANVLTFFKNDTLHMKDVTIYSGPGLATAWVQNTGAIVIDGLAIRKATGRLLSTGADGIHMADNSARVAIVNSYMEAMADDALNTRSSAYPVLAISNGNVLTIANNGAVSMFATGQTLQAVNTTSQIAKGSAHITSVSTQPSGNITVTLDSTIQGLQVGDDLFNASLVSPNILIANNTFAPFRGIFRVRSPGAVFSNNQILDPRNAQVLIADDIAPLWQEGPSLVQNSLASVYFIANVITNGQFNLLVTNYADGGAPPLTGLSALLLHPLIFDVNYYRSNNPDLASGSDADLQTHWVQHGIYEGRRASIFFKASDYLARYPDLLKAFGATNYVAAAQHFVTGGYELEQRLGSY